MNPCRPGELLPNGLGFVGPKGQVDFASGHASVTVDVFVPNPSSGAFIFAAARISNRDGSLVTAIIKGATPQVKDGMRVTLDLTLDIFSDTSSVVDPWLDVSLCTGTPTSRTGPCSHWPIYILNLPAPKSGAADAGSKLEAGSASEAGSDAAAAVDASDAGAD